MNKTAASAVVVTATASCGHTVKIFGATRERAYVLEYEAKFERCPTCVFTYKYDENN